MGVFHESVGMSVRHMIEWLKRAGLSVQRLSVSGGMTKSRTFVRILANVSGLNSDGPTATGAPALAMMLLNQLVSDGIVKPKDRADMKLWKGLAEMRLTLESFTGRGVRINRN
ncbi:MAG: FGGY-family carbohydrate kinase [Nitrososphaeria archaeon]